MPNLAAAIVAGIGHTLGALLALAVAAFLASAWLDRVVWVPPACGFGIVGPCTERNVDV